MKTSAEQQFLYGHHIMKSGLGRITEGTTQYQGVVVYSMNDLPLVGLFMQSNRLIPLSPLVLNVIYTVMLYDLV